MKGQQTIHIAYADDHVAVRKGIIGLIQSNEIIIDIEANDGRELLRKIDKVKEKPDICLLDINMPVMNGFETLAELKRKWPGIGVLVLTASDMGIYILRMILGGANGYLVKNCSPDEIVKAIFSIYNDGVYYSEIVTRYYFHAVHNKDIKIPNLTEQELMVMKKCCSDLSYAEIAKEMATTVRSIEGCRDSLFKKLNIKSRVTLVMFAIQIGVVQVSAPLAGGHKILKKRRSSFPEQQI